MIIAITGLKQSGKSTVAKYLNEKYGFIRINFKDALLHELKEFFPDLLAAEAKFHACTVDELLEKKPGHIRQLLQNFGTELRRGEHKDYWVKKWVDSVQKVKRVVVDDCRFLNEAEAIKFFEGNIVRVIRIGQEATDNHSSETEMSRIIPDYVLVAEEGSPESLYAQIDKIVESMI